MGGSNGGGGGVGSRDKGVGITSFAPYRDDSDSYDGGNGSGAEAEDEEREDRRLGRELKMDGSGEPKDESTSNGHVHGGSALQNPTRIHAKMDVSPYRLFDSSSTTTTTTTRARSARPPRNPQGKMWWHDGEISSDNEDREADAEEAIDVDALIAEQVCAVLPCSCNGSLSTSPPSCFHFFHSSFLAFLTDQLMQTTVVITHRHFFRSGVAEIFLPSLLSPLA